MIYSIKSISRETSNQTPPSNSASFRRITTSCTGEHSFPSFFPFKTEENPNNQNINDNNRDLSETKRKQAIMQEGVKKVIEVLNAHQAILSNNTAKPFELQDFGLHELDSKPFENSPDFSPLIVVSSSPDFVTMKSEAVEYGDDMFPFLSGNNSSGSNGQQNHPHFQHQQLHGRGGGNQHQHPGNPGYPQNQGYSDANYFNHPKLAVPSQYPVSLFGSCYPSYPSVISTFSAFPLLFWFSLGHE